MTVNTPDLSYRITKEKIIIGEVFSFARNFFSDIIVYNGKDGKCRFSNAYSTVRFQLTISFVKRE